MSSTPTAPGRYRNLWPHRDPGAGGGQRVQCDETRWREKPVVVLRASTWGAGLRLLATSHRVACGAAAMMLVGCGAAGALASASASIVRAAVPTLMGCVAEWNSAPLGPGRRLAIDGHAALMFVFRDRTCGFAFPTRLAQAAGDYGVFVTALGGDYELHFDPLTGSASTIYAGAASLLAGASHHTNVHVDPTDGRLVADRGARIATAPFTVLDPAAPCSLTFPPPRFGTRCRCCGSSSGGTSAVFGSRPWSGRGAITTASHSRRLGARTNPSGGSSIGRALPRTGNR